MTNHLAPMSKQLLLSTPKSRRLDLAIASLLCQVSLEYVLVSDQGHQHTETIWLFTRNSQRYAYSASSEALSSYRSFPRVESVPFYSLLERACQHLDRILIRGALRKYKRLQGHQRRAAHWLRRLARRQPELCAHWRLWYAAAGRYEPDEPRGARPAP